jgi:hypothetical protein
MCFSPECNDLKGVGALGVTSKLNIRGTLGCLAYVFIVVHRGVSNEPVEQRSRGLVGDLRRAGLLEVELYGRIPKILEY